MSDGELVILVCVIAVGIITAVGNHYILKALVAIAGWLEEQEDVADKT